MKYNFDGHMTPAQVIAALRQAGYPLPDAGTAAREHLHRLQASGCLPCIRTAGGHRRYSPNDVRAFQEAWQLQQETPKVCT